MAAFEAATHREVLNARYGCRSSPEDGQVGRHLAVGEKAGLAHTQEHQRCGGGILWSLADLWLNSITKMELRQLGVPFLAPLVANA
ncbi:hypothetical protein KXV95_007189 [Aspergillus fumigatus]|nr:hypothetical protein KXX07_006953 [Aspergillus fumigatus]KAH2650035.1 hypothetical protein KXV79_000365 [Aspergillus fumigatus]KAH3587610.1 hypothetical protein KXV95_007189 [Aspergillus fumigatus]